jgi:hypothetical protein
MKPDSLKSTWGAPLSAAEFELLLRRASEIAKPAPPQLVKRPPAVRKRPLTAA